MEFIQIIISILSGLAVCIPLIAKLVATVKSAIQEKNWNILVSMIFGYIKEAEEKFTDGAAKKEWVMSMVEAMAESVNYDYNDAAKQKISEMIDEVVDMAHFVNDKTKKI